MEEWISNYQCNKKNMNIYKPVTVEEMFVELGYLHKSFLLLLKIYKHARAQTFSTKQRKENNEKRNIL